MEPTIVNTNSLNFFEIYLHSKSTLIVNVLQKINYSAGVLIDNFS